MSCVKFDMKQDYFHWLCELIHVEQFEKSYWLLADCLHRRIFVPYVEHDENRESDGMELRNEYLREIGYPKYHELDEECTMLEMLIALARHMDFETGDVFVRDSFDDRTDIWFWEMMDNLGLSQFDDANFGDLGGSAYVHVDAIIDRLLDREYKPDGSGGLFPLKYPIEDQRNVEIWYQMAAYLNELDEREAR